MCVRTQLCFIVLSCVLEKFLTFRGVLSATSRGMLSSGTWAPKEKAELVLHNTSWSRRLLCKPASHHRNGEHTVKPCDPVDGSSHPDSELLIILLRMCFQHAVFIHVLSKKPPRLQREVPLPFPCIARERGETEKKKRKTAFDLWKAWAPPSLLGI